MNKIYDNERLQERNQGASTALPTSGTTDPDVSKRDTNRYYDMNNKRQTVKRLSWISNQFKVKEMSHSHVA